MSNFTEDIELSGIDKTIADIGEAAKLTSQSFNSATDAISTYSNFQIEPVWNSLATKEDVALDIDIIQRQLNKVEERIENLECEKLNISDICYLQDKISSQEDAIRNLVVNIDSLYIKELREQLTNTIVEIESLKEQLFKEKENKNKMDNVEVIASLKTCDADTSTADCAKVDVTALELKGDYMQTNDMSSSFANKICIYDNNSAPGVANYDTTIADTIKIADEPLQTNTIDLNVLNLNCFGDYKVDGTWESIVSKNELEDQFNKLKLTAKFQNKIDKVEMEKENKNKMKNLNLDFGPCDNTVRLSMYGIAIQNINNEWVSYNPDSREIINVDVFNMADGGKYIYKMPVAIADVKIGDIVIHNRVPMFVTAVNENGTFEVTDVRAGEAKTIIPTKSPFGFAFITKIVNLFNGMMTPDKNNPFGNMWMFAMMSDDKNFDIKDMLMISMMTNNNDFTGNMNPMMLMLMMDDKNENNDLLIPMMLMNNGMMNQSHICQCAKPAVEARQI